jgi:hypothetical protein
MNYAYVGEFLDMQSNSPLEISPAEQKRIDEFLLQMEDQREISSETQSPSQFNEGWEEGDAPTNLEMEPHLDGDVIFKLASGTRASFVLSPDVFHGRKEGAIWMTRGLMEGAESARYSCKRLLEKMI